MKVILIGILFFISLAGSSQNNIRIFSIREADKTVLYAENKEFCPVSIVLSLVLQNLHAIDYDDGVYTLPAQTGKYRLIELEKIRSGRTTYSYSYKAVFGDVRQTNYDGNYSYDLPYRKGKQFRIEQGYYSRFTHQYENALDFNMPEGTEIRAARGGVVIAVTQHFSEACLQEECKKMNNYVLVYHADGTIADYSHVQFNGAKVAVGDTIKKGDVIALSGNTGYTKGPHLHFVCFLPGFENRRTLKTRFRTGDGRVSGYLIENRIYRKNYL